MAKRKAKTKRTKRSYGKGGGSFKVKRTHKRNTGKGKVGKARRAAVVAAGKIKAALSNLVTKKKSDVTVRGQDKRRGGRKKDALLKKLQKTTEQKLKQCEMLQKAAETPAAEQFLHTSSFSGK